MRSRSSRYSALSGGILLIGIGVIFLLRLDFFPALLAVTCQDIHPPLCQEIHPPSACGSN
jgi:hypothetical protein